MLRIVCTRWGTQYTQDDVDALYSQVIDNCSVPFTFECFDSFPCIFDEYHDRHYRGKNAPTSPREIIHNGYHRDDLGGIPHYRKLFLFDLDRKYDRGDIILYLDLDTHIIKDLEYFTRLNNDRPYIVKNYWWEDDPNSWKRQYNITRCPLFNSSVLRWVRGQNRVIFKFLSRYPNECFFTYPSMDTFLFHTHGPFTPRDHFQYFPRERITSQRVSPSTPISIIHMLEGLNHNEKIEYGMQRNKLNQ